MNVPPGRKKVLTTANLSINISASVDTTVTCRVAEGLARWSHGNRL